MKKGNIIFLSGVSSAGKTTLSRALQNRLTEKYYWLSRDTFTDDMAPEKFKENDLPDIFSQCCSLMNNTIKLFSDMGTNVIVDSVMLDVEKERVDLLFNYPVMHVHVTCNSIQELRRREKERGDRDIGQGESQLARLSPEVVYDVTIDTSQKSAEECADIISELISEMGSFAAFQKMHDQIFRKQGRTHLT